MLKARFDLAIPRIKVSSAIVLERPRLLRGADFFFITNTVGLKGKWYYYWYIR
jgi:hypothetical protein